MTHRPDIDGLRALAVIPVVLFHMDIAAFSGGFIGVDVFFVISGFLITSIIAHDLDGSSGRRFSLANFYERRVRRIFPALFAVLIGTTALAAVVLLPRDFESYSKSLVATAAFASNIHFFRQYGYFDAESHTKPLLHTWSLAVEEQFYLVFPLLMVLLFRWLRRRDRVGMALAAVAVASFVLSAWQVRTRPEAAFYLAPARAWELMLGALLALGAVPAFGRRNTVMAEVTAVAGVSLLMFGFLTYSNATPFPGAAALVPCVGTAMLIHGRGTTVHRALAWPPLVFIGMISYSLYLWHWALLSLARHWTLDPLTMPQTVTVVAVAVALSAASWRYVEQPFRTRRLVPARRGVFAWGAAASVAAIAVGSLGSISGGWPSRIDPRVMALDAAQQDFNTDRPRCHANDLMAIPYGDTCRFGAPGVAPRYAMWGDSHAAELSVALGELAAAEGESVRMVTYSACPPALAFHGPKTGMEKCAAHNQETLAAMTADDALEVVFLVARYSQVRAEAGDAFFPELGRVAESLADAGKRVVLVYPTPEYGYSVPVQLARAAYRGEDLEKVGQPRDAFEAERAPFIAALDRIRQDDRIGMVDPARRLCDSLRCHTFADGHALYFDDDHLSLNGARYVRPLFAAHFEVRGVQAVAVLDR